MFERAKSFLE